MLGTISTGCATEGMFHFAHIAGGGDWEYECKTIITTC